MGAYFGGRTQCLQVGEFGDCYNYDLNSAYPWAAAQLPSLHGTWKVSEHYNPLAPWAIWHVSRNLDPARRIPPLPHRAPTKQTIWPIDGELWVWSVELAVMQDLIAMGELSIEEGFIFTPDDPTARPFAWLDEMYKQRAEYKHQGDPRHMVLKLGMNSLYGKLAQGRSVTGKPTHQSFVWAGLITAMVRARLYAAALLDPDAIIAFAVDGILSKRKLELDLSDELGAWSEEARKDLFVLRPGIHYSQGANPNQTKHRTRGIPVSAIDEKLWAELRELWRASGLSMAKTIRGPERFITMSWALAYDKAHMQYWRTWQRPRQELTAWPERQVWSDPQEDSEGRLYYLLSMPTIRQLEGYAKDPLHSVAYVPKGSEPIELSVSPNSLLDDMEGQPDIVSDYKDIAA